MLKRVGIYHWAGPGTIRITKTKYFDPKIDEDSLLRSYDLDHLSQLKNLFGVTDAWVTYSWGYSDQTEKKDRQFILQRLKNFKKLKINTHAYLQGCNLVYEDFKNQDFWARDEKGRLITYYKGRKVVCVNNPNFIKFFQNRLAAICTHDFDGVFVDNIQMGQLGIPMPDGNLPFVFAGCNCRYCQKRFKDQTGKQIPTDFESDPSLTQLYLDFRVDSISEFIKSASVIAHKHKKLFGTNSYDPKFDTKNVYGFDLSKIQKYQDYLLFENHALTKDTIQNSYIDGLTKDSKIPVFVISYRKGIGFDSQYSQTDFDLIFSEAKESNFYPLLKTSEYITEDVWHNLYLDNLNTPNPNKTITKTNQKQKSPLVSLLCLPIVRNLTKKYYNPIYTLVMESKVIRPLMKIAYELVLH